MFAYPCIDRATLLAEHPKLSQLLDAVRPKVSDWIAHRVATHQSGISNTVQFFASTNTPFPWSRVLHAPAAPAIYPAE